MKECCPICKSEEIVSGSIGFYSFVHTDVTQFCYKCKSKWERHFFKPLGEEVTVEIRILKNGLKEKVNS